MMEEKVPLITPGQKLRHKETDTIYIVNRIRDGDIFLVREDARGSMLIEAESLALSGLEPI
jgi:hypothetical protein